MVTKCFIFDILETMVVVFMTNWKKLKWVAAISPPKLPVAIFNLCNFFLRLVKNSSCLIFGRTTEPKNSTEPLLSCFLGCLENRAILDIIKKIASEEQMSNWEVNNNDFF